MLPSVARCPRTAARAFAKKLQHHDGRGPRWCHSSSGLRCDKHTSDVCDGRDVGLPVRGKDVVIGSDVTPLTAVGCGVDGAIQHSRVEVAGVGMCGDGGSRGVAGRDAEIRGGEVRIVVLVTWRWCGKSGRRQDREGRQSADGDATTEAAGLRGS